MGKKSLTKSTTKKKSAPKKKTTAKNAEVKAAPVKKAAPKAKAAPKKAPAKKKAAAKKPTLKSLLKKDFGSWAPEHFLAVLPDEDYLNNFTAPPAIDESDKAKAKEIKALLTKQFDLNAVEKPVKAEKTASKKAETKQAAPKKEEKAAAEKAKAEAEAAEKAKTEKEAEEKAKAEAEAKAKAEKEAAEKAKAEAEAAEKAKAAKEAEEKAKAEAEAKAKAEKIKAEAEAKAKASKEAAEKAKADAAAKLKAEKPPAPPVMPRVSAPTEPPMNSAIKTLITLVAGFFGLMLIASAMNTNNYYLKPADNAVEIWQGKFSPTGEKIVISIPGATIKEPVKSVYEKKEALVPAFDYYMGKAEALSKVRGTLDFKAIKSNLYKAIKFSPTMHHKKEAKAQLNRIDFMFLIHQTDAAAAKNTVEGFDAALKNLSKAAVLGADKAQRELLNKKTAEINEKLSRLKDKIKALKPAATIEKPAATPVTKKNHSKKTKVAEPAKHH